MNEERLRQIPLFESLSKDAREFIARRLKTETFAAGETIVRQGDTGNSLYIIISGLVKVTRREKDGTSLELARLQGGDYFGEMSLLAGQPRSADITTLIDTATLVLFKQDMDDILQEYPSIAVHFSKVLSKRLRDTSHLQLSSKPTISVVSIYSRFVDPLFQTIFAVNLAASFIRELMKRVLLIDVSSHSDDAMHVLGLIHERTAIQQVFSQHDIGKESDFSPYILEHKLGFHLLALGVGTKVRPRLLEQDIRFLIESIQKDYDYIVINCSKDIHKLIHTALEASDLIIYLTSTSDNAIQRCKKDVDLFKQGYGETHDLMIGVLQEEQQQGIPNGMLEEILTPHPFFSIHRNTYIINRFLRTGRPFVYDDPKCDISRSIQRFTRKIGGVRIGLVLSSGAARGFAHVGVLKVLEAYDIPIDTIAGSSMGALVGGFYAAGVSAKELEDIVLSYQDNKRKVRRTIFDMTISRYGLSKGHRLAKFMRHHIGEKTFDELQIPFIAVATDIRNGLEVILHSGLVWQALRASGSVPVMFEPYYLDGRYLIDGGISNPLPTDILIERGMDIIISCTVNSIKTLSKSTVVTTRESVQPSSHKKYGILDTLTRSLGIMSSSNTMLKSRLADIDIHPNVASIDWIDFHRGKELLREGELAVEEAMPAILELVHGRR